MSLADASTEVKQKVEKHNIIAIYKLKNSKKSTESFFTENFFTVVYHIFKIALFLVHAFLFEW